MSHDTTTERQWQRAAWARLCTTPYMVRIYGHLTLDEVLATPQVGRIVHTLASLLRRHAEQPHSHRARMFRSQPPHQQALDLAP